MSMQARTQIKIAGLAATMAPLVVVLAMRVAPTPAAGSAGHAVTAAHTLAGVSPPPAAPAVSVAAKEARDEAMRLRGIGSGPSPFGRPDADEPAPKEIVEAPDEPPPSFSLTSIMAGQGESMAFVNGRARRVGDEVAPGWRLHMIDAAAGRVTLMESETGRTLEARLAGPR
ncbi:MAG: hypothetical protein VYC34_01885 [Planctomycetota bacterium]|nr:hypothetical protein [Planctomycetota bacterium]